MKKWYLGLPLVFALVFSLMIPSLSLAKSEKYGKIAYQHIDHLSEKIGPRVAGSEEEKAAANYISQQLQLLGLQPSTQSFSFVNGGQTIHSQNIVAERKGKSNKQLIIGAHYDSVSAGKGADDNASSIGVLLETLAQLKQKQTPYTIKVVFFGAEERGLRGANYYVSQMSEQEKQNTVAMINLDSLIAGDKMYVHGGNVEDPLRDLALQIAKQNKVDLEINPGLNPSYPKGTTGAWSDHAPFDRAGIPILVFEATNWEIGDLDGYTQTEKLGSIWHTPNDHLAFIEKEFPGRVQHHLHGFTSVLYDLIFKMK